MSQARPGQQCRLADRQAAVRTGGAGSTPEHEVHELKALALQEALSVGAEHQAGAEGIKQVLHHLLLLRGAGVVSLKYLPREEKGAITKCCPICQHPAISKAHQRSQTLQMKFSPVSSLENLSFLGWEY